MKEFLLLISFLLLVGCNHLNEEMLPDGFTWKISSTFGSSCGLFSSDQSCRSANYPRIEQRGSDLCGGFDPTSIFGCARTDRWGPDHYYCYARCSALPRYEVKRVKTKKKKKVKVSE